MLTERMPVFRHQGANSDRVKRTQKLLGAHSRHPMEYDDEDFREEIEDYMGAWAIKVCCTKTIR